MKKTTKIFQGNLKNPRKPKKKRNPLDVTRSHRYTVDEVCQAIIKARGFISIAAKNLGCSLPTICNYQNKFPEINETVKEAMNATKDLAESKLVELIEEKEFPAISFFLRTRCKDRGYTDRQEITGANGTPLMNPEEQASKEMDLEKKRAFIIAFLSSLENQIVGKSENGPRAIEIVEPIGVEPSQNGTSKHIDF